MYKRVLLKLSGETLSGEGEKGFSGERTDFLIQELKKVVAEGVALGVVIGAGNLFRGKDLAGIETKMADQIGMLGTNINAIYIKTMLEKAGMKARVFSQVVDLQSTKKINYDEINSAFDAGNIVVFGGGTSNPLFTTDTAAVLRAVEMDAEIVIKATKVDGVFSEDPRQVPDALKYDELTFEEAIEKNLSIMDIEAFSICRKMGLEIRVIEFFKADNLLNAVKHHSVGTRVFKGQ